MDIFVLLEQSNSGNYGVSTYVQQLTKICNSHDNNLTVVHLYLDSDGVVTEWVKDNARHISIPNKSASHKDYCDTIRQFFSTIITKPSLFLFNNFDIELLQSLKTVKKAKFVAIIHWLNWKTIVNGDIKLFKEVTYDNADLTIEENNKIKRIIAKEKCFLSSVDYIIALTELTKFMIGTDYQIPFNKIFVIENAVVNENNSSIEHHERNKVIRFLFVGRLAKIKGITELIRAFELAKSKISDFELIIVGDGDETFEFSEELAKHVKVLNWTKKEQLFELYRSSDVGLMPSYGEECSFVGIEMMMHGLPIVASDAPGMKEMVVDGNNGVVFKIEDTRHCKYQINPSHLAEAIVRMELLSRDNNEYQAMRHNAFLRYKEKYSSDIFKTKMSSFFKMIEKDNNLL